MSDRQLAELLALFDGDEPTSEFVERLGGELRVQLADTTSADVSVDVAGESGAVADSTLVDLGSAAISSRWPRRLWLAAAAGAPAVVAAAAIVVGVGRGDGVDADDLPAAVTTETTSPETTLPSEGGASDPRWDFEITVIEVEAGNTVAVGPEVAWVASSRSPILTEISLEDTTVGPVWDMPAPSGTSAYGFGSVWVSHLDGTMSRVDPSTGDITATFDIEAGAGWIEAGEDAVWVGAGVAGDVVRIDPETDLVIARIEAGDAVGAVMENRHGVWARTLDGDVLRIDPATNEITDRLATASGGLALTVTDDDVWAPGGPSGVVYRIDAVTRTFLPGIALGRDVDVGGIHATAGSVWVRYSAQCAPTPCREFVARVDEATGAVVAIEELPDGWGAVGMSVGSDTAWTASADAVARIDF